MASPSARPYARGFAADADTERALRAGLASHDVNIQRADLKSALRVLAAEPAPRLVFVDLDGDLEPEAVVRELTEICAFDTTLIAIGSWDSAHISRTLLRHGLADYLVKPLSAAMVREASAAIEDDVPRRPYAGRVIAFAGSAGSGTSTLVAAIARDLAADSYTASIVDLDPLSGKLSGLFDVVPNIHLPALLEALDSDDAAASEPPIDTADLDDIGVPAASGISLIAYPQAGPLPPSLSPASVCALVEQLANRTHLVLVTGVADPNVQLEMMLRADARVLLFEPTLQSISATVRRLALLGAENPATLVQCLPRRRNSTMSSTHVRYALFDRSPDVVVPFDPALRPDSAGMASRRPGKAYRKAMREVIDILLESSSPAAP